MKFKSVNELICKTTSKTFQAYWRELQRHENTLRKIYAKDKHHKHVPEVVGSVTMRQRMQRKRPRRVR